MRQAISVGLDLLFFAIYWGIGSRLTYRAYEHLIDRNKGDWAFVVAFLGSLTGVGFT